MHHSRTSLGYINYFVGLYFCCQKCFQLRLMHISTQRLILMVLHYSSFLRFRTLVFKYSQTYLLSDIVMCRGYISPEYALRGELSVKTDVYSFGILLLELIGGRKNLESSRRTQTLSEWVRYRFHYISN